jgi:hypothetical protein
MVNIKQTNIYKRFKNLWIITMLIKYKNKTVVSLICRQTFWDFFFNQKFAL